LAYRKEGGGGRNGRWLLFGRRVPLHKKAILIAISKINYTKHCTDRNYVHKHAYLGSD
jgi:hypothetical protein